MSGIWAEVTARPEGGEGGAVGELVQRSWGRTMPGVLEEQRGGPCGWSRASEGERGRRGGQEGDRAGHAGPCGLRGGLGFLPPGRWDPGGLWAEEGRGLTRCSQARSGGHCREDRLGAVGGSWESSESKPRGPAKKCFK